MPEPVHPNDPAGTDRSTEITVAIPVRDGGALLERALAALARQTVAHELIVCDSGSLDGSVALAREHGARVIEITPERFSHGGTRNLLVREAAGAHVAFLTQDAEPADERWLERLLAGFALAPDVGLVYGPYLPRPDAPVAVRLELERWFRSLSPDGAPRVDRLVPDKRIEPAGMTEKEDVSETTLPASMPPIAKKAGMTEKEDVSETDEPRARARARAVPAIALIGARGFCTDANACLSRAAWERTPFREVAYAEDRVLAIDMLRAGYAKAYLPDAAAIHSHDYTPVQELKRCFDEWRGLAEVYGWREPASPARLMRGLRGELGAARRELMREGVPPRERRRALAAVAARQAVRQTGALLGSRADRLPPRARRTLSLERRATFVALDLDAELSSPTAPQLSSERPVPGSLSNP